MRAADLCLWAYGHLCFQCISLVSRDLCVYSNLLFFQLGGWHSRSRANRIKSPVPRLLLLAPSARWRYGMEAITMEIQCLHGWKKSISRFFGHVKRTAGCARGFITHLVPLVLLSCSHS